MQVASILIDISATEKQPKNNHGKRLHELPPTVSFLRRPEQYADRQYTAISLSCPTRTKIGLFLIGQMRSWLC